MTAALLSRPAEGEGERFMRVLESTGQLGDGKGGIDADKVRASARVLQEVIVGTAGRLNAQNVEAMMVNAGAARAAVPFENLARFSSSMISMMPAERIGTGLQAIWRQFVSGEMTDARRGVLQAHGLLEHVGPQRTITTQEYQRLRTRGMLPESEWAATPGGDGRVSVQRYRLYGRDALTRGRLVDQFDEQGKLLSEGFFSMIARRIRQRNPGMSDTEIGNVLADVGGTNRSDSTLANADAAERQGAFRRDRDMQRNVAADPIARIMEYSIPANVQAMETAWGAFTGRLTETVAPIIVPALQSMTGALGSLTEWVRANPGTAQTLMIFAGALTATAVAGAGIAALAAGIALLGGGAVAAGIAAASLAVGVITTLIYLSWNDFVVVGKAAVEAIKGIGGALSGMADTIMQWVAGLPARMWAAIRGAAPSETGAINDPAAQAQRSANGGSAGRARAAAGGFYNDAPLDPALRSLLPGATVAPGGGGDGQPQARPMSFVPPTAAADTVIPLNISLDGDVVYRSTTRRLARDAARPPTGSARPDSSMVPFYPGAVGASI